MFTPAAFGVKPVESPSRIRTGRDFGLARSQLGVTDQVLDPVSESSHYPIKSLRSTSNWAGLRCRKSNISENGRWSSTSHVARAGRRSDRIHGGSSRRSFDVHVM